MIFGIPGSGKSTFALKLSEKLLLPLEHLDKYFYIENWVERDYSQFLGIQQKLVDQDRWIIDGNNTKSFEMRYSRADTALYFRFNRLLCLYRVFKRLLFKDHRISDRADGCPETVSCKLIRYMWGFDDRIRSSIEMLQQKYPHVQFHELHNQHDVKKFMEQFSFKPVDQAHRSLVHAWLKSPHASDWFYGQGLQNTLDHLDHFLQGSSKGHYWLAFDKGHPFAFLITSSIEKPTDPLTRHCTEKGEAITLDILIGDTNYLGKGLAPLLIKQFLQNQFPHAKEVLIDPEKTNTRAIHVYQKVGFKIIEEFIPSHSPHPHLMMHLKTKDL